MPTKQIDRLMFAQGGYCYFCQKKLGKHEASVEHLVATANGGRNADENCVACCKALNSLFGSMSLKEKLRIVLNQKGNYSCPNSKPEKSAQKAPQKPETTTSPPLSLDAVIANLKQRGQSRPRRIKTLKRTISSLTFPALPEPEVDSLFDQLLTAKKIAVNGQVVTYSL